MEVLQNRGDMISPIDSGQQINCSSLNKLKLPRHLHRQQPHIENITVMEPACNKTMDCPSWLIKATRAGLLARLEETVSSSLGSGELPTTLKEEIVFPLLKKPPLDPVDMESYRPVQLAILGQSY